MNYDNSLTLLDGLCVLCSGELKCVSREMDGMSKDIVALDKFNSR